MKNSDKLKKIQEAYYELIKLLPNGVVQDYYNVLTQAPSFIKELIADAEELEGN